MVVEGPKLQHQQKSLQVWGRYQFSVTLTQMLALTSGLLKFLIWDWGCLAIPGCVEGLLLGLYSGITTRTAQGDWSLNLGWPQARQVPYLLYYIALDPDFYCWWWEKDAPPKYSVWGVSKDLFYYIQPIKLSSLVLRVLFSPQVLEATRATLTSAQWPYKTRAWTQALKQAKYAFQLSQLFL